VSSKRQKEASSKLEESRSVLVEFRGFRVIEQGMAEYFMTI
jgi:hypothetical protein